MTDARPERPASSRSRARRRWALSLLLGALLAWAVWSRTHGASEPSAPPDETGATTATSAPSLATAPPSGRRQAAAPVPTPPSDGLTECEIHVTTFGDPPQEVRIRGVSGREMPSGGSEPRSTVRVRTRAGSSLELVLEDDAAVSFARVNVPDPVPPRLEVRVPARDDPRLLDPVLLVVDEVSGKPLPDAFLDPGPRAPEEGAIHADARGRIRVPRALAERLKAFPGLLDVRGMVAERNHYPRTWSSLDQMNEASRQADWVEWDAAGAMPVRLEPFPSGVEVPRRRLRIVGEDGKPMEGRLVLMRTPSMRILFEAPFPGRTDAAGVAEVVAPSVAAYDVYDGPCLVGSFVLASDSMPADGVREIRVPKVVRVHVILRGLTESPGDLLLCGPDVVSLEPDDKTGWARLDGTVVPGWKAFGRAEGTLVSVPKGLPVQVDLLLPRGRPVPLQVSGREAVLTADEPKTIEIDWTTLPPPPREPGSFSFSLTREGLDELPGGAPSASMSDGSTK